MPQFMDLVYFLKISYQESFRCLWLGMLAFFIIKIHLFYACRTLYQRVTRLMKQGIKLVFVADGKAPEWKQKAMARRKRGGAATNNLDRAGLKFITEKVECIYPFNWGSTCCVQNILTFFNFIGCLHL